MTREELARLHLGGSGFSLLKTLPDEVSSDLLFVYAPGAGSNLQDPFGRFLAGELAGAGIESWRFQFPYMEARRSAPDRPPLLEAVWRQVLEASRSPGRRVVAGGRSMGGRIASQVVAQGEDVAGLVLFAYPLRPPGRPDRARIAHLPSITAPTLFCSGTRDSFGSIDELRAAAALLPRSSVHVLEGADHGFNVLKSSGRNRQDVWNDCCQALQAFLRNLGAARPASGP